MTIRWFLLKMCYLPPVHFPKHNTNFSNFSNSEIIVVQFHDNDFISSGALVEEWNANVEVSGSIPANCIFFTNNYLIQIRF